MDYIVIEGVPPYDGRWEFDLEGRELTTREWGWIKRFSGYLPLTIDEGLSDPELIVVWACVALTRAQKATPAEVPQLFERLIDAPYGSTFTLETDVVEEEVEESRPSSVKLERERRLFWSRFDAELGDIGAAPESLWDARLGYFGVRAEEVGERTPGQLMGCVDLFQAMHGGE